MIAEAVRRFAEDPAAYGEIDPTTGFERVLTDRYCLLFGPVPSFTQVSRLRLDPDEIAETIHEVREEIARRAHHRATWHVGTSATPPDLVDRLLTHGFVADDHSGVLVLGDAPDAPTGGVTARRIADRGEFDVAASISNTAFAVDAERSAEWASIADEQFAAEREARAPRAYLAFVDDRPVGAARSLLVPGCPAALLIGGAVLPDARGQGVYRALVRARWDDAAAEGFAALGVHAGALSRPILERLGFGAVAEIEVLGDPATC